MTMRQIAFAGLLAIGLFPAGVTVASADWAIAVGQADDGNYGYGVAWNYQDTDEARHKALSDCRSEGRNCKVVADGAGKCAALAFSKTNNGYGWSAGDTKREAIHSAMEQCHRYADSSCEVRSSFCDDN